MEKIEISGFTQLPCGENSHQQAYITPVEGGIDYDILSRNKELSYIDFLNLSSAIKVSAEFFDVDSAVIVKEAKICAAALGATSDEALSKVIDCDPISVYESTASFSKEAFSYLLDTNITKIKVNTPLHEILAFEVRDIKVTPFGILVQEQNNSRLSKETFNVVTQVKPTQQQAEDGIFAWKIAKHLTSQSAVIAKNLSAKAIVQGKTSGVIATEEALDYACDTSKDAVLVLDGAVDNIETINAAIQGRIGLIIEAGDGKNSSAIIKLADKYELSIIHTKIRNHKY